VAVTAMLVSLVITMEFLNISEFHISMLLGMGLGISTSPLMMTAIMSLRSRRKVNKMLKELAEMRKQQGVGEQQG
jgi:uncharacterized membrane protein YciS (DUF1049 family)